MWIKRTIPFIFLIFFSGSALYFYMNLKLSAGQSGFYYDEEWGKRQQLESFWEKAEEDTKKKIQEIALYRMEKNVQFYNPDLNRSVEGDLTEIAGGMQLIIGNALYNGNVVSAEGSKGCVISREMAYRLFGTVHALGETLCMTRTIGEKQERAVYIVRGILNTKDSVCMIQGEKEQMYPYVRVSAKNIPLSVVKQKLAGFYPGETKWYWESDFYISIGRLFLCQPLWMLFPMAVAFGKKYVTKIEHPLRKEVMKVVLMVTIAFGVYGILVISLNFSEDYIPTAWSDFEFFTELFRQKTDMILQILRNPWHLADMHMMGNLMGVIVCSCLTMAMLGIWGKEILLFQKRV